MSSGTKLLTTEEYIAAPRPSEESSHHLNSRAALEQAITYDICRRCSKFVRKPEEWEYHKCLFIISEPKGQLAFSNCGVCRFFSVAMSEQQVRQEVGYLEELEVELRPAKNPNTAFLDLWYRWLGEYTRGQILMEYLAPAQEQASSVNSTRHQRVDFEEVKGWIYECKSHETCRASALKGTAGTKVINCKTRTVQKAPINCQYVALSYVWGNMDEGSFDEGDRLIYGTPQTIEDSMIVCVGLGYDYLWVDRYVRNPLSISMQPSSRSSASTRGAVKISSNRSDKWARSIMAPK